MATLYPMVKSKPLVGPVWGGRQRHTTEEWTIPGPSLRVQPVPVPSTQWMSSTKEPLKFALSRLGVIERVLGVRTVRFTFTMISQPLKGSTFATFTW